MSWSLNNGDDDSFFEIDKEKGILNFKNPPDFENPEDLNKNNIYKVGIRATDLAGNISDQILSTIVGDVDDTPALIIGPSATGGKSSNLINISENIIFVYVYSATEEVTWSLYNGDDDSFLEIDKAKPSASLVIKGNVFKIYFDENIDLNLIKNNLLSKQLKYQAEMDKISSRINNKDFVKRAPKHIVEQEKSNYTNLENDIKKISATVKNL